MRKRLFLRSLEQFFQTVKQKSFYLFQIDSNMIVQIIIGIQKPTRKEIEDDFGVTCEGRICFFHGIVDCSLNRGHQCIEPFFCTLNSYANYQTVLPIWTLNFKCAKIIQKCVVSSQTCQLQWGPFHFAVWTANKIIGENCDLSPCFYFTFSLANKQSSLLGTII